MAVASMTKEELFNFVSDKFTESIAEILKSNEVDGEAFLNPTDGELREMFPKVGLRVKIRIV